MDEDGNRVEEIPDGQGIEKGCETIGKLFGEGEFDHSHSKDWQTEMKLSNAPAIEQETVETKNPFRDLEL